MASPAALAVLVEAREVEGGGHVHGTAVLQAAAPLLLRTPLLVCFQGMAVTCVTLSNRRIETRTAIALAPVCENAVMLLPRACKPSGQEGWWACPPGRHELPFTLAVPAGLPPTGQATIHLSKGAFKYAVVAKVDVAMAAGAPPMELRAKEGICVNPSNMATPSFVPRSGASRSKTFTFSRSSQPLLASMHLPMPTWHVGETVPIRIEIDNASNQFVKGVTVTLVRSMVLCAERYASRSDETIGEKVIVPFELPKNSKRSLDVPFQLPARLVFPSVTHETFSVGYALHVLLATSAVALLPFEISEPIWLTSGKGEFGHFEAASEEGVRHVECAEHAHATRACLEHTRQEDAGESPPPLASSRWSDGGAGNSCNAFTFVS